jgi:hypothetical protein
MPRIIATRPILRETENGEPFQLTSEGVYPEDLARRYSGATPRQLRYWSQIGLVRASVRETGGRAGRQRLYSATDLRRLRLLVAALREQSLQSIRRSLEEIAPKVCPGCGVSAFGRDGVRQHQIGCWWTALRPK